MFVSCFDDIRYHLFLLEVVGELHLLLLPFYSEEFSKVLCYFIIIFIKTSTDSHKRTSILLEREKIEAPKL